MYRWAEHTGELELEIHSPTEEAVFADAVEAMADLLAGEEQGDASPADRRLDLHATDRPRLLAAWLAELAFLAETEGFVAERVTDVGLRADGLSARLSGHVGSPPHLVKAVTYHRLLCEPHAGGWRARAVLDV